MPTSDTISDVRFPDGMLILFLVIFGIADTMLPPVKIVSEILFPVQKHRIRNLFVHPLRSPDRKPPGIIPRQRSVQCERNCFAPGTFNDGSYNVSLRKRTVFQDFVIFFLCQNIVAQSCRFGGCGRKRQHPVPMIDIQHFGNGSQFMGGIIFTISAQVIAEPVMAVLLSPDNLTPQVMVITPRTVYHLSEQTFPDHIQHHQLPSAKAAVFQKHKWCARLLISLHQRKAVPQFISAAYFHCRGLTCVHGVQSDFHMAFPRCGNNDSIHIFIPDYLPVIGINRRFLLSGVHNCLCPGLCSVPVHVTDSRHLFALSQNHLPQQ